MNPIACVRAYTATDATTRGATLVQARTTRAADLVWVRWDPATKTANLTIAAAYNQVGSGFNFDGYNPGHLTITVSLDARVVVSYTNRADVPHSEVITPYDKRALVGNFPLAFPGSASAGVGIAKLKVPQVFSFTAGSVGSYAIV